ncbi:hypothetical protein ACAX43_10050 [Paraburkholderia sp. IW21]
MTDSMLAILIGIIVVMCGAAIWAATSNREKLTQWFHEHHLRDLMHHRH